MKAWEQLSGGNIQTWDEIHNHYSNEKKLFISLGIRTKLEIDRRNFEIAAKYNGFDNIPKLIKQQLQNRIDQWEKKWAQDSEQSKKLDMAYDDEMNKHLERIHRYCQTTTQFPENKQQITEISKDEKEEMTFEELVQEQIKEVGGQRKVLTAKEFIKEIKEAKEENRTRILELNR
jgi:hypothetical protein